MAIGDGLGMLTVVPFGLLVTRRLPPTRLGSIEGALALGTVTAVTVVVFNIGDASGAVASGYLVLLHMVWAAVRLQVAGAAVSLLVVAHIGNTFNALGSGPFATTELTLIQGSVQLQFLLASAGVTVLLLACRTVESETFQDLADMRAQLIAAVSHELRKPVTPEVVALAPMIDEQLVGRDEDIDELSVTPADAQVYVDRTHLVQILTNLVDNAIRHGRPPIAIRVTSDGERTWIVAADRGEGVPEWFVTDLFEEFAQAHEGDQRPTLGLGLGLPIARALAVANDVDLTYGRDDGETRFVLRLPADRSSSSTHDPAGSEQDVGVR